MTKCPICGKQVKDAKGDCKVYHMQCLMKDPKIKKQRDKQKPLKRGE